MKPNNFKKPQKTEYPTAVVLKPKKNEYPGTQGIPSWICSMNDLQACACPLWNLLNGSTASAELWTALIPVAAAEPAGPLMAASAVAAAAAVRESGGSYDDVNRSAHEDHWPHQQFVSGAGLQQSVLHSELDTEQCTNDKISSWIGQRNKIAM